MSQINLYQTSATDVVPPASNAKALFLDTDNSIKVKDSTGGVLPIESAPSDMAPAPLAAAAVVGVEQTFARGDHQHEHGPLPGGDLHQVATATENGFMSPFDRVALDGLNLVIRNGTLRQPTRAITSSSGFLDTDFLIVANASGGNITVTLPSAADSTKLVILKKTDASANFVRLAAAGGELVDGVASIDITTQNSVLRVLASGPPLNTWNTI